MKRYIALLRGINISGKNKIAMSDLKRGFTELDFTEIVTFLNSGNIIFSSTIEDKNILSKKIKLMIKQKFALEIPLFIISQEDLKELLRNAPPWWGDDNKEIYDNLIFLIPPLAYEELYNEIGAANQKYEKVESEQNAVFWSFSRKDYQKTNWWSKTATSTVSNMITIRTANTVKKIANM